MSLTNLTNNPVFQNMSKEKQDFLIQFSQAGKPQNKNAFLPFLMQYKRLAQSKNIQFDKNETQLLIELLCKNLPPKEKEQVQKVLHFLQ